MVVAVVERFKREQMYGLSAGIKKNVRCIEVAVSGVSTVLPKKKLVSNKKVKTKSSRCYLRTRSTKLTNSILKFKLNQE